MDIYADLPSAKPADGGVSSSSATTPAAASSASKSAAGSWAHSKFQGMIANRRTVKAVSVSLCAAKHPAELFWSMAVDYTFLSRVGLRPRWLDQIKINLSLFSVRHDDCRHRRSPHRYPHDRIACADEIKPCIIVCSISAVAHQNICRQVRPILLSRLNCCCCVQPIVSALVAVVWLVTEQRGERVHCCCYASSWKGERSGRY